MRFWPSASSPPSQLGPSASTSPACTSSPLRTMGRWLMQPDWLERWNFGTRYSSYSPSLFSTMMVWPST